MSASRMNDEQFEVWAQHLGLSKEAIAVIQAIRHSEPSRRVASFRGNWTIQYASKTMGCSLQAESRTVALPKVIDLDNDDDVLEIYDEPKSFWISYIAKNRQKVKVKITADYFVIRRHSAGWIECKSEIDLQKLAVRMPNRFRRDENGRWESPPALEYARPLGLTFEISTDAAYEWVYLRNLQFGGSFLRSDAQKPTPEARKALLEIVRANPGLTLEELFCEKSDLFKSGDVYYMILHAEIYVDLYRQPLPELDVAQLFPSSELAQAYINIKRGFYVTPSPYATLELGSIVIYDERRYVVKLAGAQRVALALEEDERKRLGDGEITESNETPQLMEFGREEIRQLIIRGSITVVKILPSANEIEAEIRNILIHLEKAAAETNRKCDIVEAALQGKLISDTKERTLRHWKMLYRLGLKRYHSGYYGLVPKHFLKGNRLTRQSQVTVLGRFLSRERRERARLSRCSMTKSIA